MADHRRRAPSLQSASGSVSSTGDAVFLRSEVNALLADFARYRDTATEQHELLLQEAAHWQRAAEEWRARAEDAGKDAGWRTRAEAAEADNAILREALEMAELERDELQRELDVERERSARLFASVAHLDRTAARLRESNARFERENRLLHEREARLHMHGLTDATRDRLSPRHSPRIPRDPLVDDTSRADTPRPPSGRDTPSSEQPPLPSLRALSLSSPQRGSPSRGENPITGAPFPSSPAAAEGDSPLNRTRLRRIKDSRSRIFDSSSTLADTPITAHEPGAEVNPDNMTKKEIEERVDRYAREKTVLESQLQKPAARKRKDELAAQLEGAEKELGRWKMRLRLWKGDPGPLI